MSLEHSDTRAEASARGGHEGMSLQPHPHKKGFWMLGCAVVEIWPVALSYVLSQIERAVRSKLCS